MHAQAPQPQKSAWQARLARSGYLVGAILLHLVVFLLVATWVIWKAPQPPSNDAEFHPVSVKVPTPPVQLPASSGATASNPDFEPQPVTVPVVTPPSVVMTSNNNAFTVDAAKDMRQALDHTSAQMARGSGLGPAGGGTTTGTGSAFGSSTGSPTLLTGYFYDLKQTSDKQPTGLGEAQYLALLTKYVAQGWDDSLLKPYYRSKSPLYTGSYAISTRDSGEAPKAFGLEKEVQPGLWIVHYHARVQAPVAGEYRLSGFADNVMVVKIRGETVLDGGWDPLTNKGVLHQQLPFILPSYVNSASNVHVPHLKIGPSFHIDTADPVDMDVLMGDCGGTCSFFLFIEKVGNKYETTPDGNPKYPFFQLEDKAAPTFSDNEEHPPYSTTPEPWQPK